MSVDLPLARYRFHFLALQALNLPSNSAAMWRGALGYALAETVCTNPARPVNLRQAIKRLPCATCPDLHGCPYPAFYESFGGSKREKSPPRPSVLQAVSHEQKIEQDDPVFLDLVLFGWGNDMLPWLIQAVQAAGEAGLGPSRTPLLLLKVLQETDGGKFWQPIFDAGNYRLTPLPCEPIALPSIPQRILMTLETPLHLKTGGKLITRPSDLGFKEILKNLFRRISSLQRHYGDTIHSSPVLLEPQLSVDPVIEQALHWSDTTQYSTRQKNRLKHGGFTGRIVLNGNLLTEAVWELLWLGQWTHIGNKTFYGLGRYVLSTATSIGGLSDN